jgi:hypothetical protein
MMRPCITIAGRVFPFTFSIFSRWKRGGCECVLCTVHSSTWVLSYGLESEGVVYSSSSTVVCSMRATVQVHESHARGFCGYLWRQQQHKKTLRLRILIVFHFVTHFSQTSWCANSSHNKLLYIDTQIHEDTETLLKLIR